MADTFGQWLKRAATDRFGTLRAFAAAIGKEPTYISRWVNDHERPSYESARMIADLLEIPIAEVLSRAGMPIHEQDADPPPRSITLPTRDGDQTYDLDVVVKYVESKPDRLHQERLARWRRTLDQDAYERIVAKIYVAWTSNSDLVLSSLETVNGPGMA